MSVFQMSIAVVLLASIAAGFHRLLVGPSAEDRLVAAQLLGTTAVGVLLLLAEAFGAPSLRYVGLVFASLAAVTIVAYVRLGVGTAEPEAAPADGRGIGRGPPDRGLDAGGGGAAGAGGGESP